MYHRKQKFRGWLLPLFALSISLYPSAVTAEEEEAAANSEELTEETGELPQEAPAVPYMAWDEASGTVKEVEGGCTDYTLLSDQTVWDGSAGDAWYAVNQEVAISGRITVTGKVHLILCDGAKLTAENGITVNANDSLFIYGQSQGSGELNAAVADQDSYGNHAVIGGAASAGGGSIIIHGGIVNAVNERASNGAAIGGGMDGSGGSLTVYGGTVHARIVLSNGAAIGGGYGGAGGTVLIQGGEVLAEAGNAQTAGVSAAIGGGMRGAGASVTVNGGTVTAISTGQGAGIGGGILGDGGDVTISGGTVSASCTDTGIGIGAGFGGRNHGALNIGNGVQLQVSDDNTNWSVYDGQTRTQYMKSVFHVHAFADITHSADGSAITATCTAEGCYLPDHKSVISIMPPTLTIYGQKGEGISSEGTFADRYKIWGAGSISYYRTGADGKKTGEALNAAPVDAGTYWAEIVLPFGETSLTMHVVYTIAKAEPVVQAPEAEAVAGQMLRDVSLTNPAGNTPGTWTWAEEESTPVGSAGRKTFRADFTPEDSNNYNRKRNVEVTVNVRRTERSADIFRMYNPNSGEHFFTGSSEEKEALIRAGWNYEGVAFRMMELSYIPVYRLYNPNAHDHHYTVSIQERNSLMKAGWKDEGVGWYADDRGGDAVYRLYNPNAEGPGAHHYTLNIEETENLIRSGWKSEGIGFYACR